MPETQTMKISDVRSQLNTLVNQIYRRDTRLLIEKNGIPVAVLISPHDFERFLMFEREREERFKIIDEVRAAFADVPQEEIEREAEKAIAEVRAEMRAERDRAAVGQ